MRAFGVHFARIRQLGESTDSILQRPLRSRGADPENFGPLLVRTSVHKSASYVSNHMCAVGWPDW